MRHLSEAQIESIVMGSEELPREVRTHLSGCAQCSDALRKEAERELAIHDALERNDSSVLMLQPSRVRPMFAWGAAAAAAAVLVLLGSVMPWRRAAVIPEPSRAAAVYRAMAPESLAMAPGFLEPKGLQLEAGDSSFSMIGRDVFVELGELVMIE